MIRIKIGEKWIFAWKVIAWQGVSSHWQVVESEKEELKFYYSETEYNGEDELMSFWRHLIDSKYKPEKNKELINELEKKKCVLDYIEYYSKGE